MPHPRHFTALLALLIASASYAAPRQLDVSAPGGFLNACAAPSGGGSGGWAGDDISGGFVSGGCDPHYFNSLSSANGAASSSGPSISNNASGWATMGQTLMSAENHSPAQTFFAHGAVNGGYTDQLTISLPGFNGQAGYLLLRVGVAGTLQASAETGAAGFEVVPYVNKQLLNAGNPGYDDGSSNHLWATDRQVGAWGVASAPDASLAVNEIVVFSLPVVVGQALDVGIYAMAEAGQRSSGGFPGWYANSQVQFGSFLAGAPLLMIGGQAQSGFSISSASGFDWTQAAAVPEPQQWALWAAGLGWLVLRLRRRAG